MKTFVCFILFILLAFPVMGDADLTQSERKRLTEAKALLMDVESRSVDDLMNKFAETGLAREQLQIYEAIAATFRDIIDQYGKKSLRSRKKVIEKIRMNMAYFQLGGSRAEQKGGSELDRLIQRKLKQYLPEEIWDNTKLFHSLGE